MPSKPFRFNDAFDQPAQRCPGTYPDPVDMLEPLPAETQAALFAQMAELLTPVFLFLSQGKKLSKGGKQTDTMGLRAWVITYVVRPDLMNGESIPQYAARIGVTPGHVGHLVSEFRSMIPAFESINQKRRRSPTLTSLPPPR